MEKDSNLAAAVREKVELPGPDGLTLAEKAQQSAAYYLLIGLDAMGIKLHRSYGHAGLLLKMACQVRRSLVVLAPLMALLSMYSSW